MIDVKNTEKLQILLDSVNGRASTHVMTASDVQCLANRVERDLTARGVNKKDMIGATVIYVPEMPGKSYARKGKYCVTNMATLVRIGAGWRVKNIKRYDQWSDSKEFYQLNISEKARESIIKKALRDICEPPGPGE